MLSGAGLTAQRWEPFTEPWRTTAIRTGGLALAIGLGVGVLKRQLSLVPLVTLLALWFTLGGHVLEIVARNRLRLQLLRPTAVRTVTRLAYWFAGGSLLYVGAVATGALLIGRRAVPFPWWLAGAVFVGVELAIHSLLRMRGQPSFYDGRG